MNVKIFKAETKPAKAQPTRTQAAVTGTGTGCSFPLGQPMQMLQSGWPLPAHLQTVMPNQQTMVVNRPPVQLKGGSRQQTSDIHKHAASGVQGTGGKLPHHDKIQSAFGRHDISHIRSYTGVQAKTANQAIGSEAYATGNKVAFADSNPDVFTAAHEVAHIVQQQAGVQLKGGVGEAGDKYEKQADQVADLVVQGKSAEAVLNNVSTASQPLAGATQFRFASAVQLMEIEIIPSPRSLRDRLINFASDTNLGKLNKRPSILKNEVDKLITKVLGADLNSIRGKLILLRIKAKLAAFLNAQSDNPFFRKDAKERRREHIEGLITAIDNHVGTGKALRKKVMKQSKKLRSRKDIYDERFVFAKGVKPHGLEKELKIPADLSGEEAQRIFDKEIPEKDRGAYVNFVDDNIKTAKQSREAGANSLDPQQQADLKYIIDPTYGVLNRMLRDPTNNQPTPEIMLKAKLVLDALSQFHPVKGKEVRFATVFPGGIKDPKELDTETIYEENSFIFVGKERPSDKGYKMSISFSKGYYIPDSFGVSTYGQPKDQYVLPPGSKFKYLKTEGSKEKPIYEFTQVE